MLKLYQRILALVLSTLLVANSALAIPDAAASSRLPCRDIMLRMTQEAVNCAPAAGWIRTRGINLRNVPNIIRIYRSLRPQLRRFAALILSIQSLVVPQHSRSLAPLIHPTRQELIDIRQNPDFVPAISRHLQFTAEQMEDFNRRGIFVFDIDKTLAGHNQPLGQEVITQIQALLDSGHLVVINTGQDIDMQRHRVVGTGRKKEIAGLVAPLVIPPELRNNLVIVTNDGSVIHHFHKGEEYVVQNAYTRQWQYNRAEFTEAKKAIDALIQGTYGYEYEEGGVMNRENTQIAFKIEATAEKRSAIGKQIEGILNKHVFADKGVRFRAEVSGKTTVSLMIEARDVEPGADEEETPQARAYRLGLRQGGPRRSLKPEAFRFLNYEFLHQGKELNLRHAVYFGDEWERLGNDRPILEAKDLREVHLMNVGNSAPIEFYERAHATVVGGGPVETARLLKLFLTLSDKPEWQNLGVPAIIQETARQSTDWEQVVEDLAPAHEALLQRAIIRGTRRASLHAEIGVLPTVRALEDFRVCLQELRIGPQALKAFYSHVVGGNMLDDFSRVSTLLTDYVDAPSHRKLAGVDEQALARTAAKFAELLEQLLGRTPNILEFRAAVDHVMAPGAPWKGRVDQREATQRNFSEIILGVHTHLEAFLKADGELGFKMSLFGGRIGALAQSHQDGLPLLHSEAVPGRAPHVVEMSTRGRGGSVTISGGGGSKLHKIVSTYLGFHALIHSKKALTIINPAEDDGGGTGVISYLFQKHFGINLPAMGDFMNTLAGASLGESNRLGLSSFPYIFNVLRTRFPEDAQDVFSQFRYVAHEQVELARQKGATADEMKRLVNLLQEMYEDFRAMEEMRVKNAGNSLGQFLDDLGAIGLPGNSLGNLWYVARGVRQGALPVQRGVVINPDHVSDLHNSMAETLQLEDFTALPSNLDPGKLYAVLPNVHVDINEAVISDPANPPETQFAYGLRFADAETIEATPGMGPAELPWTIKSEGMDGPISENQGMTIVNIPLADLEGKEPLVISERTKEFAYGGAIVLRTRVRVARGRVVVQYRRGAEDWSAEEALDHGSQAIVGMGSSEWRDEINQTHWGGRLVVRDGNLCVTLNRLGNDTVVKLTAGPRVRTVTLRDRVVVHQTKITEAEHYSALSRMGFVSENGRSHDPAATKALIEAINEAEGAIIIGPGSIVTSLCPVLLVKDVRDALRRKAESGTPVIYIANPYNDNETQGLTLMGVMKLIENSIPPEEKIFGRGGFIREVIANDWTATDAAAGKAEFRLMTYADTWPELQDLRKAEWPRGPLDWHGEENSLNERRIHLTAEDYMTLVDKEIRGWGLVDGIGYDPRKIALSVERVVLEAHRDRVQADPHFRAVSEAFSGDLPTLYSVIEALKRARSSLIFETDSQIVLGLAKFFESAQKYVLTPESWSDRAPEVMVINASHSLFSIIDAQALPISAGIRDAIVHFLETGGVLVVPTGWDARDTQRVLFEGANAIPAPFADQIFIIGNNGATILHGTQDQNLWGDEIETLVPASSSLNEPIFQALSKAAELFGLRNTGFMITERRQRRITLRLNSPFVGHVFQRNSYLFEHFAEVSSEIRKLIGLVDMAALDPALFRIVENVFSEHPLATDVRPYLAAYINHALAGAGFVLEPAGENSLNLDWLVSLNGETLPLHVGAFRKLLDLPVYRQNAALQNNPDSRPMNYFFAGRRIAALPTRFMHGVVQLLPKFAPETVTETLERILRHIEARAIANTDGWASYGWQEPDVIRSFETAAGARRLSRVSA
jgi:hydroxymethylpyrimidine pyrophosphatase-like HAD family hydrolase